jgi:N-acetylglutamate synthase-like GNAT family acetyltransferase
MAETSKSMVSFRKMTPADATAIAAILKHFANRAVLLWRTTEDIIAHEQSFYVVESSDGVMGCVALHDYGNGLSELRSLAVREDCQGQGLGAFIVTELINEAQRIGVRTLFALTKKIEFFSKFGFLTVEINEFPEKIWKDCQLCPKREKCDETPVVLRF